MCPHENKAKIQSKKSIAEITIPITVPKDAPIRTGASNLSPAVPYRCQGLHMGLLLSLPLSQ